MGKESYKVEADNFEGDNVCEGCPKLGAAIGLCTVYSPEGMHFRQKIGNCPVVNRYASWHKDKPIIKKTKKRIGQQKQGRQ